MQYAIRTLLVIGLAAGFATACESEKEEAAEAAAEEAARAAGATEEFEEAAEESAEETVEELGEDSEVIRLTYGGNAAQVNSVIFQRVEGAHDMLGFYEDDVDCATVKETPGDDTADKAVVTAEVEPVGDMAEGDLVIKRVLYGDSEATGTDAAKISVTKLMDANVEGTAKLAGKIDDDVLELEGPFVATVCDVEVQPTDG
jgi:hypothetical protein